ncbi:MAG TPA: hypothetical protein DDX33_03200, partial [Rikenellaceae bacterium]|nr:hypothetical protein [Rikenellaceae bacterium]
LKRFNSGFGSLDGWRITEVEIRILPAYLCLDMSVFFKREAVVIVADKENSPDSPYHKLIHVQT